MEQFIWGVLGVMLLIGVAYVFSEIEEKSKEKNVEIQEKVVTQTKVVKEKGKDIIQYIDREVVKKEEVVKFIENCPIPKDIIDAHNAAATLNKAIEAKK